MLEGHLRQSLIGLTSSSRLAENSASPVAMIQVLKGSVEVTTGRGRTCAS